MHNYCKEKAYNFPRSQQCHVVPMYCYGKYRISGIHYLFFLNNCIIVELCMYVCIYVCMHVCMYSLYCLLTVEFLSKYTTEIAFFLYYCGGLQQITIYIILHAILQYKYFTALLINSLLFVNTFLCCRHNVRSYPFISTILLMFVFVLFCSIKSYMFLAYFCTRFLHSINIQ